ncbi:MAG: hypothetical protein ACRDG8_10525 [Actinomycetota bacterium]
MTSQASPDRPGALGALRALSSAAGGGLGALLGLLAAGQAVAVLVWAVIRVADLATWVEAGVLTSLAAVRAEIVTTFRSLPDPGFPLPSGRTGSSLVPMTLTIVFVCLAGRTGRHAARRWHGAPALARVTVAAAGAGVSVSIGAALAATYVSLSIPGTGVTIEVDATSAALWAGLLAGGAAALGAFLEVSAARASGAVIRGGVLGFVWALALLTGWVLVVATVEPEATRGYVDGLRDLGPAGAVLFGAHLLALPAQSAILIVPAAGSCIDVLASGATAVRMCPWELEVSGPLAGAILPAGSIPLSPWLWGCFIIPPLAAFLGGRRASRGGVGATRIARGALAGLVFAGFSMLGAVFSAPRIAAPLLGDQLGVEIRPWSLVALGLLCLWGVLGGAIGGALAGRAYDESGFPRPTSA